MRIVAVSDTHQNTALLQRSVKQAIADGNIDAFIHCGDGVRDVQSIEAMLLKANPAMRIYAVRGNCDLAAQQYPASDVAVLAGLRTLITHGHYFQVKRGLGQLVKAARSLHCTLAFFGHTHHALRTEKHGITLINPGSLAAWQQEEIAYLEVLIDDDHSIREIFIKVSQ